MTRRQKLVAALGAALFWVPLIANQLNTAKNVVEAPHNLSTLLTFVRRMFDLTPTGVLFLVLGACCLAAALWRPAFTQFFVSHLRGTARSQSANSTQPDVRKKREFTNLSGRELLLLYEGGTALQAKREIQKHVGFLTTVEGQVAYVRPEGATVVVLLQYGVYSYRCRFVSATWEPQLGKLSPGEAIKVIGEVHPIQDERALYLVDCELPEPHPLTLIPPSSLAAATPIHREGSYVYRVRHLIGVRNDSPDHRTLRHLEARAHIEGPASILYLKDRKEISTDLHAGAPAYFELGYVLKLECDALVQPPTEEMSTPNEKRELFARANHPSFRVTPSDRGEIGLSGHNNKTWRLTAIFTAESMAPLEVTLQINPDARSESAVLIA